jgi:malonyl-CoA O-methyltransferase
MWETVWVRRLVNMQCVKEEGTPIYSLQYLLIIDMPIDHRPPTIDPAAATRWQRMAERGENPAKLQAPWLHEEVGSRMQERLQWIKNPPNAWAHWAPVQGGLQTHQKIAAQYLKSECFMVLAQQNNAQAAIKSIVPPFWKLARWQGPAVHAQAPADGAVQLVWANMLLHMQPDPLTLIAQWQRALAVDGFLMFSCLGPDTLRELQGLYNDLGLGPCSHTFTDMHDWGDMLVQSGFAEPVMDMERIVLSFATPARALQELRGLGRNLHPQRFAGLRGRGYKARLEAAMRERWGQQSSDGAITLTFEVIYGHAYKPTPRIKVSSESAVSMQDMRAMLAQRKP